LTAEGAQGHTAHVFVGVFEHRIDANGRVGLPATFRDELPGECYLRRHPEGYLTIVPPDRYQEEGEALLAKIRAGEATEADLRELGAESLKVAVDKQGRITLDEASRRHAGIRAGSEVTFSGDLFWFSIWRPSRFAVLRSEAPDTGHARQWEDEDDE
jgi:DNA-binding transcriptional regulator/RsmH inhibitor MraZ